MSRPRVGHGREQATDGGEGTEVLAGAWNTLPVAGLGLGASVLAVGLFPQLVSVFGVLPTVGGFLVQVLAQSTGAPRWVMQVSPYAHLAPVPAVAANWAASTVMAGAAAALAVTGAAAYHHRDLRI